MVCADRRQWTCQDCAVKQHQIAMINMSTSNTCSPQVVRYALSCAPSVPSVPFSALFDSKLFKKEGVKLTAALTMHQPVSSKHRDYP